MPKDLQVVSRIARYIAIGVWPVCIVLSLVVASGQDAAGRAYPFAIGFLFALAVSGLAGLVYWVTTSPRRLSSVSQNKVRILSILVVSVTSVVVLASLWPNENQYFAITVTNSSNSVVTEINVNAGDTNAGFERLESGEALSKQQLRGRPAETVRLNWRDADGNQRVSIVDVVGGVPYRFEAGSLDLSIGSDNYAAVEFRVIR